jgi:Gnt-I system high-affinity gluconate transporter
VAAAPKDRTNPGQGPASDVAFASAVIIIVFGARFAQILIQTRIAEGVIHSAVELAGDRPPVLAMTIRLVTPCTSMNGAGAAIAIGVIALPIMLSQGIRRASPPRMKDAWRGKPLGG